MIPVGIWHTHAKQDRLQKSCLQLFGSMMLGINSRITSQKSLLKVRFEWIRESSGTENGTTFFSGLSLGIMGPISRRVAQLVRALP
jgi:hypothetical protein